jgi:hypothetical protein
VELGDRSFEAAIRAQFGDENGQLAIGREAKADCWDNAWVHEFGSRNNLVDNHFLRMEVDFFGMKHFHGPEPAGADITATVDNAVRAGADSLEPFEVAQWNKSFGQPRHGINGHRQFVKMPPENPKRRGVTLTFETAETRVFCLYETDCTCKNRGAVEQSRIFRSDIPIFPRIVVDVDS